MIIKNNDKSKVMGILNLTPDSFYDGNKSFSPQFFLNTFNRISKADIVDIGAESSKPGSKPISKKEEIKRLQYFFEFSKKHKCLSIDSYKSEVITYCLDRNFNMINDISGGGEKFINIDIAKDYDVPICLMHMRGTPENMQKNLLYKNIIEEITFFFNKRLEYALKIGIKEDNIILDPGLGFGKSLEDNFKIISNIKVFKSLGFKLLIGLSRKSFLKYNNNLPQDRLLSSIAMQAICVNKGVDIIRTHDVNETISSLKIVNKLDM